MSLSGLLLEIFAGHNRLKLFCVMVYVIERQSDN